MQLTNKRVDASTGLLGAALLACFGSLNLASEAGCKSTSVALKADALNNSLTGKYKLERGHRNGVLYVKEQATGKIQFFLRSTRGMSTGEMGGVVQLKNHKGVFKGPDQFDSRIVNFNFTPGHCVVVYPEQNHDFGGVGVDPNGTYRKVNAKVPTKDDLFL